MVASALVELPAARLRAGDVLVSYGEQATVERPPVVSVDGAMITAVVATGEGQSRVVRMPVGLRVEARRPVADTGTSFVRATKVAQSSGARIALLDLSHPDSEIPAATGEWFATLCTAHHTIKTHAGISTAQAQATHPEQWCGACTEATRQRAHERVYGTPADGTATGVGA